MDGWIGRKRQPDNQTIRDRHDRENQRHREMKKSSLVRCAPTACCLCPRAVFVLRVWHITSGRRRRATRRCTCPPSSTFRWKARRSCPSRTCRSGSSRRSRYDIVWIWLHRTLLKIQRNTPFDASHACIIRYLWWWCVVVSSEVRSWDLSPHLSVSFAAVQHQTKICTAQQRPVRSARPNPTQPSESNRIKLYPISRAWRS